MFGPIAVAHLYSNEENPVQRRIGLATGALLAAAALPAAAAPAFLGTATRSGNYGNSSTTAVAVPLDNNANTALQFTTTKPHQKIRILYNAECAVIGPANAWVSVTVLVDGKEANPASGSQFGFCTATSTTNYVWTGTARQSIAVVPTPGLHTLQIMGQGNNGATNWWLGDSSVVID